MPAFDAYRGAWTSLWGPNTTSTSATTSNVLVINADGSINTSLGGSSSAVVAISQTTPGTTNGVTLVDTNGSAIIFSTTSGATAQVTVTASGQTLLASSSNRMFATVKNTDNTTSFFIGLTSSVTTASGFTLKANTERQFEGYTGPIYGITTTGSQVAVVMSW